MTKAQKIFVKFAQLKPLIQGATKGGNILQQSSKATKTVSKGMGLGGLQQPLAKGKVPKPKPNKFIKTDKNYLANIESIDVR